MAAAWRTKIMDDVVVWQASVFYLPEVVSP